MAAYRRFICWLASPIAGSFVFLLSAPLVAWSAEQTVRVLEDEFGSPIFLMALGATQVMWIMGYGASSLPKWAKWSDGTSQDRLEIVAGVFGAACSGNVLYLGGMYGADMKQIYCFIGAIVGGFAGDKVLSAITDRYVNRASIRENP